MRVDRWLRRPVAQQASARRRRRELAADTAVRRGVGRVDTAVKVLNIHTAPVVQIKLNAAGCARVVRHAGVIEYWNAEGGAASGELPSRPRPTCAMAKAKATPLALAISPDGEHFAITASDAKVRLFRWASGKLLRSFDEGYDAMNALQKGGDDAFRLEAFDFGRRMAVEREYRAALAAPAATASSAASAAASNGTPPTNVLFDASGRYLSTLPWWASR